MSKGHNTVYEACSCVIHVEAPGSSSIEDDATASPSQSCSGLILDSQRGLILTSGGLFSHSLSTSDLKGKPLIGAASGDAVRVILSSSCDPSRIRTLSGRLVGLWQCETLRRSLEKLFSGDGWSFQGDPPLGGEIPGNSGEVPGGDGAGDIHQRIGVSKESCRSRSSSDDIEWLSSFALIEAEGLDMNEAVSLSILPSSYLFPGMPVCLSGTPFGSLCPPVFAGSYAAGIVSNVAGDALVFTDVRCLPGTEGAPVFYQGGQDDGRPHVVGIVVAPMCWKTNQWVGLSVVCSLQEILRSMFLQLPTLERHLPQYLDETREGQPGLPGRCHNFLDSIKLVKVGPSWGSGVVVHSEKKLLLTCRHVVVDAVNNNQTVFVSIDREANTWQRARVVFSTSHKSVIDLAIIQIWDGGHHSNPLVEIPVSSDTRTGESVFAVGFPLFGPATTLRASVTSGHVSKVIRHKDLPVMLQTSCAIHPGSSGGALVSKTTGHLVGIIANNCRDDTHNVTIPHLNFGIPSSVFLRPLKRYIQSGDVAHLNALNIFDKDVESLWKLQYSTNDLPGKVTSKL